MSPDRNPTLVAAAPGCFPDPAPTPFRRSAGGHRPRTSSGPPIQEHTPTVTSPVATASLEDPSSPQQVVRKSRKGWRLAIALVAIVGIAFASSACTPKTIAQDAIKRYWGKNASCAERVVQRESNFQADAVNRSSGTTGLFQLHPVHATWIKATYGYSFSEMKDPSKNAKVAKGLSDSAYRYWGDGWQPWRLSGKAIRGGGCPA